MVRVPFWKAEILREDVLPRFLLLVIRRSRTEIILSIRLYRQIFQKKKKKRRLSWCYTISDEHNGFRNPKNLKKINKWPRR